MRAKNFGMFAINPARSGEENGMFIFEIRQKPELVVKPSPTVLALLDSETLR